MTASGETASASLEMALPVINVQIGEEPGLHADGAGRLAYIDGLRGLAIGMVLLFHIWRVCGSPGQVWWNPVANGYLGVDLFLLLSGFCLYRPFVRQDGVCVQPSLRRFLTRRARRLLPPYYLALTLFTILALCLGPSYPEGPHGGAGSVIRSFAWHACLMHNLRTGHIMTLAGPFWSLALEVDLYIAMPILIVVARRFGVGWAVGLATLVSVIYHSAVNLYVGGSVFYVAPPENSDYEVLAKFFIGSWVEFGFGMWAADLIARRVLDRSPLPLGLLACLMLGGAAWLSDAVDRFRAVTIILTGFGFFLLILQGSREPARDRKGVIGMALRTRPLIGLGIISYSVYLLHQPLLLLAVLTSRSHLKASGFVLPICLGVSIPVIIGLAYLFYMACEKPFINRSTK